MGITMREKELTIDILKKMSPGLFIAEAACNVTRASCTTAVLL
jgi:hypothetical protein